MKTSKNILIITAAVLLTLTGSAQNTKAFHYASLTGKTATFVSAKVNNMAHFLSSELESLKAVVFYKPITLIESSESYFDLDFSTIQEELKKDAKFYPVTEAANLVPDQMVMETIIKELEKETKFNPEETVLNSELSDIVYEISKDVKYIPSAI